MDRLKSIYELVQPTFAMDVLVYTPEEFAEIQERDNPFIEMVTREGVVICENPQIEENRWLRQAEYDLQAAEHKVRGRNRDDYEDQIWHGRLAS